MTASPTRRDDLFRSGSSDSLDELMPVVYEELKRIASRHRRSNDATLSTTEIVHEAYLKLAAGRTDWNGRAHFFGAASHAMRQVLVDFARRRDAVKRGGGAQTISLGDSDIAVDVQLDEILALDAALDRLDRIDPRLRRIVELRFFGGVPQEEIAAMFGVSTRTVERDWLKARLVLLDAIGRD